MAANNAILYNAALAGFAAGSLDGTPPLLQDSTKYAALANAAAAFAGAVDAQIPADAAIVSPVDKYTEARAQLIQEIAKSASGSAYNTDATSADYTNIAKAIAAVYTAVSAKLI